MVEAQFETMSDRCSCFQLSMARELMKCVSRANSFGVLPQQPISIATNHHSNTAVATSNHIIGVVATNHHTNSNVVATNHQSGNSAVAMDNNNRPGNKDYGNDSLLHLAKVSDCRSQSLIGQSSGHF